MFNNVNGQEKGGNKVDDIFAETEADNSSPASRAVKAEPVNVGSGGLSSITAPDEPQDGAKKKGLNLKAVGFIILVVVVVGLTAYLAYTKFFAGDKAENPIVEGDNNGNNATNNQPDNVAPVIEEPTVGEATSTPITIEPIATSTATSTEPIATSTPVQADPGLDSDSDALSDIEEQMLGTNITAADTDGDGLSDYEEVKVYNSNPLLVDTDGDTYSDLEEVRNGYNPNGEGKLGA